MQQRDWFAVGVRLFGVYLLTNALSEGISLLDIYLGYFTPTRTGTGSYVVHIVISGAVGLYLLAGAPLLVTLAFGPKPGPNACASCGYDLTDNTSEACPECGTKVGSTKES